MSPLKRLIMLITIALHLIACSSVQPVRLKYNNSRHGEVYTTYAEQIELGEQVYVSMLDGTQHSFIVTAIDDTTISSDELTLQLADVAEISKEQFDFGNSARAGGAAAVVIGVVGARRVEDATKKAVKKAGKN
ncbi:hypothetical protein IC617_00270 [Neiella sp. HB171785]|uniref:Uncharacterized protein n=1 Tax=Neiella litorisoli TaxID=2771431 RepID=A0A8J6R1M2_9GAMM|nr:hypothetical protein [Neiella litorisoli]MBD1387850.1 hypothetical protein [Neiella litorisoli]